MFRKASLADAVISSISSLTGGCFGFTIRKGLRGEGNLVCGASQEVVRLF